jgi:hypothetical protein
MKDIPGFPGYKITEEGKLYNPKGKLITRVDHWEGYPRARLKNEEGKFVNRKIHRLVALAHLGVNDGEIRHKDNNRANVAVHNLEWGDRFSNAQDRLARGSYHLKTKLVGGKSLLILGDDKYLDPEAKKVYKVTDHPIGEEGVIPVTSLEKVAYLHRYALIDVNSGKVQSALNTYVNSEEFRKKHIEKKAGLFSRKPGLVDAVKNKFHVKPLIDKTRTALEGEGFTARNQMGIDQLRLAKYKQAYNNAGFAKLEGRDPRRVYPKRSLTKDQSEEISRGLASLKEKGLIKKAEWTSKKNADKHAKKHAEKMGMSEEEYKAQAVAALKQKKALISTRGDAHKTRVGNNILVHKDGKVITYYSKVAYVKRISRHLNKGIDNFQDWGYHQDVIQTHQDIKEKRKKK